MNHKLMNILTEVFELKTSEINTDLTKEDVSSWDSLRQMDLVTSLESEFSIELEMLEIASMNSIKSIIDVLKSKGITIES